MEFLIRQLHELEVQKHLPMLQFDRGMNITIPRSDLHAERSF